jgi:hypothetical protein
MPLKVKWALQTGGGFTIRFIEQVITYKILLERYTCC